MNHLRNLAEVPRSFVAGGMHYPLVLASGAAVSVVGRIVGLCQSDSITNHLQSLQSILPCLEHDLPQTSDKPRRYFHFIHKMITQPINVEVPFFEELHYRVFIQGILLTMIPWLYQKGIGRKVAKVEQRIQNPVQGNQVTNLRRRKVGILPPSKRDSEPKKSPIFWTRTKVARIAVSSVVFGLAHLDNEGRYPDIGSHVLGTLGHGLVYSYLYEKYGPLYGFFASWGAHYANNVMWDLTTIANPDLDLSMQNYVKKICNEEFHWRMTPFSFINFQLATAAIESKISAESLRAIIFEEMGI